MEIKKKYEELAKKYNIPSFDEINNEFEIALIDEESIILREIRRKITEKKERQKLKKDRERCKK